VTAEVVAEEESMADTDTLSEVVRRLDVLEAEREIRQTMVRYAETLDYGDNTGWAQCFTPDGVFDIRRRGEALFKHEGTDALSAFADSHTSAPSVYHKHILGLPTIEVERGADTARARAYFMMVHESPDGPFVLVFGRYIDTFTRSNDNVWRIAERIVDMEDIGTRHAD
jgi:3-phenylpropionate/cinnamic acid dioxygenase small subunit